MALESINVGFIANDGTGDDLRTAFIKINQNFEELELQGGQANTIHNIGTGIGLYKEKIGVDLRLKSLIAGPGITLTDNPTDVTITNNRNMIVTVNANTGSLTATSATQEINIVGGSGVSTQITGNTLTINGNTYTLETDSFPTLNANLNANTYSLVNIDNVFASGTVSTNNVIATGHVSVDTLEAVTNIEGLLYGIDIRDVRDQYFVFDFGPIVPIFTTPVSWLLYITDFDMGTIDSPSPVGIDGGSFV